MIRLSTYALATMILLFSIQSAVAMGTVPPEPFPPPATPMNWWGYWNGSWEDAYEDGVAFIENKAMSKTKLGINMTVIALDDDLIDIPLINRGLESAKDNKIGILLVFHHLINNGCAQTRPEGGYGVSDYNEWDSKLVRLRNGLSAKARSAIMGMIGFNDMNPYAGVGCLVADPGQTPPIEKSLQMFAARFPEVPYRGHIWRIIDWNALDRSSYSTDWFKGSNILVAYSYHWEDGQIPARIPYCPHKGTTASFPRQVLPENTHARSMQNDLQGFLTYLNSNSAYAGTPVIFVPPSYRQGSTVPNAEWEAGVGCTLETFWYFTRCLSVARPFSWASQIVGFMPFNWDTHHDFFPTWLGTEDSPELIQSGRWVGKNRSCTFHGDQDFADNHNQGNWLWRYQECNVDSGLTTLTNCADMATYDANANGGTWRGSGSYSSIWSDGAHPAANAARVVARSWTATKSGTATAFGNVSVSGSCSGGDGVRFAIFKGASTKLWPASGWAQVTSGGGPAYPNVSTAVVPGDTIRFVIQRGPSNNNCDTTTIHPRVRFKW